MPQTILTKKQAADNLCISIQNIDKLIKSGALPHIQLSVRRIGILQSDVLAYIQSNRVSGVSRHE